jgi:hypothetical protein
MLITQAEWARGHGFSRQYVSRLVKRSVVRLIDGKVDPAAADAALAAQREPARTPRRAGKPRVKSSGETPERTRDSRALEPLSLPQVGDLSTLLLRTRIKSEVERGRLLELKAKVEAGKYVDADEVKVAAFNRARIVRDELLSIPDQLAAVLAAETDARKVHVLLAAEVRQALEELTGGPDGSTSFCNRAQG